MSSADSKPLDCILLQYLFDGEEQPISQPPHVSPSANKPYRRSASSTRSKIINKLKEGKQVSEVYDEVVEQQGGLLSVNSLGCIPKGRQEISNVKRAVVRETTELRKDEMVGLVELGMEESFLSSSDADSGGYVRFGKQSPA